MDPQEAIAGVVLAGGESKRFGTDKASAVLAGRTLLQWVVSAMEANCAEIVIAAAAGQPLPPVAAAVPVSVVRDARPGLGPLAGLVQGLAAVRAPLCLVASCDAPLLQLALVEPLLGRLLGSDAARFEVNGRPQPLPVLVRREVCLPALASALDQQVLKLAAAFTGLKIAVVEEAEARRIDPALESFINVNTPADLARAAALVAARTA